MVIYEITVVVEPELAAAYEEFMRATHIPDVLDTGCFLSATMSRAENRYRISYFAADQATLDRYLNEHAPRLRSDFTAHFSAGIEITRDIWNVVADL